MGITCTCSCEREEGRGGRSDGNYMREGGKLC